MRRHLHPLLCIRREESHSPALADLEARLEGACTAHGRPSFDGVLTE
jgi:hypothetical protein